MCFHSRRCRFIHPSGSCRLGCSAKRQNLSHSVPPLKKKFCNKLRVAQTTTPKHKAHPTSLTAPAAHCISGLFVRERGREGIGRGVDGRFQAPTTAIHRLGSHLVTSRPAYPYHV